MPRIADHATVVEIIVERLSRKVVANNVLPGVAALAEDGVAIVVVEVADTAYGVVFIVAIGGLLGHQRGRRSMHWSVMCWLEFSELVKKTVVSHSIAFWTEVSG